MLTDVMKNFLPEIEKQDKNQEKKGLIYTETLACILIFSVTCVTNILLFLVAKKVHCKRNGEEGEQQAD
jgi:hypothetical protein